MKEINEILAKEKGSFAVAFKDLQSGEMLLVNENEIFHAASTMKTPVMMEVFRQVHNGKISLTMEVRFPFRQLMTANRSCINILDRSVPLTNWSTL